jgi:hypothetical protein
LSTVAAFVRTWQVGRYRATLSCPSHNTGGLMSAVVEWEPHVPRDLTDDEMHAYRTGRDNAMSELMAQFSGHRR